jgi:hypothetical protein
MIEYCQAVRAVRCNRATDTATYIVYEECPALATVRVASLRPNSENVPAGGMLVCDDCLRRLARQETICYRPGLDMLRKRSSG